MPKSNDDSATFNDGFHQSGRLTARLRLLATLGLGLASISTGALVVSSLTPTRLPGCGGSMQGTTLAPAGWGGCDDAGASVWGRVVLGNLSVSTATLGLGAYVGTLILMWFAAPGAVAVRWVMRGLLLCSMVFVIAAISQRFWCPYCIAAHVGVLLAWIGVELSRNTRGSRPSRSAWVAAACAGVLIVSSVTWVDHHQQSVRAGAASEAAAQAIVKPRSEETDSGGGRPATGQSVSGPVSPASAVARFTGRYRLGDAMARARIVVISDFQCADCQKVERELLELAARPGVSLSMKHFPFCRDCNPNVPRTLHANACWAARAAEAAGMVGGDKGFWEMHHWLFARGGGFTEPELRAQVAAQGLAVDQFMAAFTGRETLDRVKADVAEAMTLGISRTPMVFINGVECGGWESAGTVTRIVEAVLEANLPGDVNATDQPPRAKEKYLAMWRAARIETSAMPGGRQRGDGLAKIEVVGDYQESGTRELCAILDGILAEGWSTEFTFHHYPADPACNPAIPRTMNDRACELSTLVIAAGVAGGDDAYWKAHDAALVLAGSAPIPVDLVTPLAHAAEIDVAHLRDQSMLNGARHRLSAAVAKTAAISISELPTLFINGKRVARWKGGVDSQDLIRELIKEACGGAKRQPRPESTP